MDEISRYQGATSMEFNGQEARQERRRKRCHKSQQPVDLLPDEHGHRVTNSSDSCLHLHLPTSAPRWEASSR